MKFAATINYGPDMAKLHELRPTHRAYLVELLNAGKLALSGPFTDDTGALIVYEAETLEEAEAMLRADPFSVAGVFASWTIHPWKPVYMNRELFTF